jgi:hypothetical protein
MLEALSYDILKKHTMTYSSDALAVQRLTHPMAQGDPALATHDLSAFSAGIRSLTNTSTLAGTVATIIARMHYHNHYMA